LWYWKSSTKNIPIGKITFVDMGLPYYKKHPDKRERIT
jgi:hypothetical protein